MANNPPFKTGSKVIDAKQQRNAAANELDILFICEDGSVKHAWYRNGGWVGIETISTP